MSGYSTVRILTPEERIRQQQREINNIESRNREQQRLIDLANQRLITEGQKRQEEMRRMEQANSKLVNSLQSDLKQSEIRQQQALKEQNDQFQKVIDKERENVNSKFDSMEEWTKERLEKNRKEYLRITEETNTRVEKIEHDVNQLFERENTKQEIFQKRFADMVKLVESTSKNPDHERFAPGELRKILSCIKDAEDDAKNGDVSAANASLRDGYRKLAILRMEVRQKKNDFRNQYDEAMASLELLLDKLESKDVDLNTKIKDIDYWTDDEYSKLKKQVKELKSTLESGKDSLQIEDVKKTQKLIGELEKQQLKIVKKAKSRIIASSEREKMAIAIAKKLEDEKYPIFDGNGYESNDPRKAYLIKSKVSNSPQSTEIIAVIDPISISETEIVNRLVINSNDHFDDIQKNIRSQKIANALKEIGCEVEKSECKSSDSIHELEGNAVNNIIKEGSSGIPEHLKKRLFS